MQGEEQQFRRDEMMYDHDRGGPHDGSDQGDWVVGEDSDSVTPAIVASRALATGELNSGHR